MPLESSPIELPHHGALPFSLSAVSGPRPVLGCTWAHHVGRFSGRFWGQPSPPSPRWPRLRGRQAGPPGWDQMVDGEPTPRPPCGSASGTFWPPSPALSPRTPQTRGGCRPTAGRGQSGLGAADEQRPGQWEAAGGAWVPQLDPRDNELDTPLRILEWFLLTSSGQLIFN